MHSLWHIVRVGLLNQGKRVCSCHRKHWLPEEMSCVAKLCHIGKRAYDNLYYIATKQGKRDWFKEQIKDEDKLHKMFQAYWDKNPHMNKALDKDNKQRGKRSNYGNFCLITFIESTTASSGVINDCLCVMMWREQYIDFAATAAGGLISRPNALIKWTEMQKPENNPLKDMGGPGPTDEDKLRIGVVKEDVVIFRNALMHDKTAEAREASVRKPTEQAAARERQLE